jgi:hypothetical protein
VFRWVIASVFAVYLVGVGYGTFGPSPGSEIDRVARSVEGAGDRVRDSVGRGARPVPREAAREATREQDEEWFGFKDPEDAANVVMFTPFGVLFPLVFPPLRRWTVPAGVALSGVIELLQLTVVTHRSPQWDDIWWNGWGAVIGFAAFVAVRWWVTTRSGGRGST